MVSVVSSCKNISMDFIVKSVSFLGRKFCTTTRSNDKFLITGDFVNGIFARDIGSVARLSHSFTQEDVNRFADLNGDNNPLHIDPKFATGTIFGGTIVHGIFVTSLFSTLFGRSISGSIYVSQNVSFKRPVHVGTEVTAFIEVMAASMHKKGQILTCKTYCKLKDGAIAVDGEAKVLVPHPGQ